MQTDTRTHLLDPAAAPTTMSAVQQYISSRFPLGLGNFAALAGGEAPSTGGDRPFGLRFGRPRPAPSAGPLAGAHYDHRSQLSIDRDGVQLESRPGTGSMQTTGPSSDGQGSTGGEEWTPDYAGDM